MDERAYFEAAIPEPFTILGLRLRPLSMGHLTLLHRMESPYVVGDSGDHGTFATGHLAVACLICSRSYQDGLALLDTRDLPEQLARWGARLRRPHWWSRDREIPWQEKHELFAEYIQHSIALPEHYWTVDGNAVDAPLVQIVRLQLMTKCGFSERELMDRPWRLCLWDMLTLRATDGQLRFVDSDAYAEAQRQADELAKKMDEEKWHG